MWLEVVMGVMLWPDDVVVVAKTDSPLRNPRKYVFVSLTQKETGLRVPCGHDDDVAQPDIRWTHTQQHI